MQKVLTAALIAGFLVVFGIWGYNRFFTNGTSGDVVIEQDHAKSLKVDIDFGYGDLFITGGSDEWMTGSINTNSKRLQPVVSYKNKKSTGIIAITQKSAFLSGFRKIHNDWDLQLTNQVPIDLEIDMGVSDSHIDLSDIRLSSLSIDAGVSDATIDLSGEWHDSFKADIDLGVGDATILLPKETGVRLTVSKGIGSLGAKDFISEGKGVYVNEAYKNADVVIDMKIDLGVGDLVIDLVE